MGAEAMGSVEGDGGDSWSAPFSGHTRPAVVGTCATFEAVRLRRVRLLLAEPVALPDRLSALPSFGVLWVLRTTILDAAVEAGQLVSGGQIQATAPEDLRSRRTALPTVVFSLSPSRLLRWWGSGRSITTVVRGVGDADVRDGAEFAVLVLAGGVYDLPAVMDERRRMVTRLLGGSARTPWAWGPGDRRSGCGH
jgi:hypothetical protein